MTQLLEGGPNFESEGPGVFFVRLSFAVRVMKATIFFRNQGMFHLVC
jgi:hypothetical protein